MSFRPRLALVTILLAGAAVGVLFAPKSGQEMRTELSDKVDDLKATLQKKVQDNHITEVILSRIGVLAIGSYGDNGQTASQAQDSGPLPAGNGTAANNTLHSSNIAINVTVAVDQEGATRLIHFAANDDLYLALLTDSSNVQPGRPLTDKNAAIP